MSKSKLAPSDLCSKGLYRSLQNATERLLLRAVLEAMIGDDRERQSSEDEEHSDAAR